MGRVINDLDSVSMAICVKFMYLGECQVSHDNVAAVLYTSELLQIDGLKRESVFRFS